jgi:predicted nucleic acid-binding Zn ribbon protein
MASRKNKDQPLKVLIQEMLKNAGMDGRYTELEIIRCYKEVVGDVIARKTLQARVRNRTLQIKLDSGPLKEELSMAKRKIIGLVNERMGVVVLENMEIW